MNNNTMNHRGYFNRQTSLSWSQNYTNSRSSGRNRYMRSCSFRILPGQSEFSPVGFLKHLAERVARALRFVSAKRRRRRQLPQDSSSSSLGRSNSKAGVGASVDPYRTDAVEDCIEFIHSSFSRSNSSTTATCR